MWLLFHRNAKTRPVRGGHTFVETCPQCAQRATFIEVEIEENIGMFFVDIVGDKQRAYRCTACSETFDLKDKQPAAAAAPAVPQKSAAQLEREQAAARAAQQAKAEAKATRIEDELAALKKRLGKTS